MFDDKNNLFESMADSLEELLRRLRADKEALDERIRKVERDLSRVRTELPLPSHSPVAGASVRRRRGSNREAVRGYFDDHPNAAVRVAELAISLGIPRSSLQAAVKAMPNVEIGQDGFVRRKPMQVQRPTAGTLDK